MTHSYSTTIIDDNTEQLLIKNTLKEISNIQEIHFPLENRRISLTLKSYISIEKINKFLKEKGLEFQLVKQLDVHPDFTEDGETTGKIFKDLGILLIAIFILILIYSSFTGFNDLNYLIRIYFGSLLFIFGILKLSKFLDFAESHQRYDIISKHFVLYAYLYPFIEITLGVFLILNFHIIISYLFLIFILFLRILSVLHSIVFGKRVEYAYLDGVLKIRISYATIFIDSTIIVFAMIQLGLFLEG